MTQRERRVTLSAEAEAELIALRRDLHAHPELGYHEERTAALVADRLRAAGLSVTTGIARTGVIGVLDGGRPGPTWGFRADMDALPLLEGGDVPYRSQTEGVMHACGHDVHTTVGVGVAELLARHRDALSGRVVFFFQPNEEGDPSEGRSGGFVMAESGELEEYGVEGVFALHCLPELEVGRIGYTRGAAWAACDRFDIVIEGRQTHGAYPHAGIDPIVAAAQMINALQTIPSRTIDAREACVVSVGPVHAGNMFNVIPGRAWMEGILRTLSEDVRTRALQALDDMAEGVGKATGATITVQIFHGADVTDNSVALVDHIVPELRAILGGERVVQVPSQMGSEDFCAFSSRVPSVYMMLGVRGPERGHHPLHAACFDVDEACIATGVEAMASMLLELRPLG